MGLFKSKDERRVEREMKIRSGHAVDREVDPPAGEIRRGLHQERPACPQDRRRGAIPVHPRCPEENRRRQEDARAAAAVDQERDAHSAAGAGEPQFAESMNLMAREIGRVFGEMDLTKTQAQWERAVAQAGSMEERMEIFLDSMEQSAISGVAVSATRRAGQRRRDRPHDPGGRAGRRKAGAGKARRAGKRNRQRAGGDEAEGLTVLT